MTRFSITKTNRCAFLLATLAVSFSALSEAAVFGKVQNDQSQIGFTFEQMGVKMDGRFKQFQSELSFDSEQPEKSSVKLLVPLASVDLGSPAFNDEVSGKDWFNAQAFPNAEFVSKTIKPLGEQRYEVAGTLSIKGHSHDIVVPATFSQNNGLGVFTGTFNIERGAFKVGEGSWSGYDIVANPVTVNFKITATPTE